MRKLTPSQKLWAEIFGPRDVPPLREEKVLELVNLLPDGRERQAVLLRFWHGKSMRKVGKGLPRVNGTLGVSRTMAIAVLRRGLRHLKHPSRRAAWEEAKG